MAQVSTLQTIYVTTPGVPLIQWVVWVSVYTAPQGLARGDADDEVCVHAQVDNKSGVSTFDLLDFMIAIVYVAHARFAAENPSQVRLLRRQRQEPGRGQASVCTHWHCCIHCPAMYIAMYIAATGSTLMFMHAMTIQGMSVQGLMSVGTAVYCLAHGQPACCNCDVSLAAYLGTAHWTWAACVLHCDVSR